MEGREGLVLTIILIYFGAILAVGWYARKSASKSADDYILGGRRLNPFVLAMTMMAYMWAGGPSTVGGSGYVWAAGLEPTIWIGAGAAFGFAFGGVILAPFLRRMAFYTLPDILSSENGTSSRLVSGLILILRQAISVGVDLIAVGVIVSTIIPGISFQEAILGAVVVTIVYTLMGGMWAVAMTDTVQIILVFAGVAVLLPIILIFKAGGIGEIASYVLSNPDVVTGQAPLSPWVVFSLFFMTSVFCYLDQGMYQRYYAAKRPKDAVSATLALGVQWAIYPAIWGIVVAAAKLPNVLPASAMNLIGEKADNFFPAVLMYALPPVLGGVLLAVVLAAMMSTVDSLYLSIGSNFARDIWQKIIRRGKDVSDAELLRMTRVGVVLAGVIAAAIALPYGFSEYIVETQFYAYRLSIAFLAPVFGRLFWPKTTQAGIVWGMLTTVVVIFGWGLFGLDSLTGQSDPTVGALVVNILVTVLISLFTHKGDMSKPARGSLAKGVSVSTFMTGLILLISAMHPAPILRDQVGQALTGQTKEASTT